MAKKAETAITGTVDTKAPEAATADTAASTPAATAGPAAITPVTTTAVAQVSPEYAAKLAFVNRLPDYARAKVMLLKRPTPEEIMNIVMTLPVDKQEAMVNLVAKTNPEKQGLHTENLGFEPTVLKVYHGVGNDPVKPRQTLPGQFYSADSRVLGEKLTAVPLALYEGHILWPPQDQGKSENKAPICVSVDRKTGSKYGSCNSCPMHPDAKKYSEGGCMSEITAYLLDQDMTSIYEMKFVKTSYSAGRTLLTILKKQKQIWDRWFVFEAKERVEGTKKWYVVQTSTPTDATKVETPTEFHQLYAALSKVIDYDVYYQKMSENYLRSKSGSDAAQETPPPAFDETKFMADESTPTDYSKDI